ncbi:hypothetical protein FB451DRAFT_1174950 [Mycena latifolia]|nr:hypothetical protein FB451DRAFT_1174950 [Mycena latifolia]
MPHEPSVTDIQLSSIIACLNVVLPLLNELHDGCGTPFLQAISNTGLGLISAVQNVKRNKEECVLLMENIHHMLYAIVKLHIQSEPAGALPHETLDQIGKFTNTLHKIHTFLQGQQDGNRFKHFFRQSEVKMLLAECHAGLQQAAEMFKASTIEASATLLIDVHKMQEETQQMHKELLDLISNISDEISSDGSSSMYKIPAGSQDSSTSFAILPAKPKIFHGRESELNAILDSFNGNSPRIAILGAGGIGKTSLAKAILHHPNITQKYDHRFFVACDSATTSIELVALVGSNLGLQPGRDLTKPVFQYFCRGPPCLLVLDNLESSWESWESRSGVEEFLSLLTDVHDLALIITMRGAERPAKVRWTHPLLLPLTPLSNHAACQTFIDITDNHDNQAVSQLLQLTDNLPLAVDLLAHLVDYEGCSSVLNRWQTEKTSLLSEGHDKSSNLNSSIAVSLSSPRMTSGAKNLLSLLSILPDGLSDVELLQSKLPIKQVLQCRSILLQTSLAYKDNMRLKVLVPIREYMQYSHPPTSSLVQPLQKYFHSLLQFCGDYRGVQTKGVANQIVSNLSNIHHILLACLHQGNPDLVDTISCAISLNVFRRQTSRDRVVLMDQIPAMLPKPCDHRLEAKFITEVFLTANRCPIPNPDLLIQEGLNHLANLNDDLLASKFHMAVGGYYLNWENNIPLSMQFRDKALELARACANLRQQALVLNGIAHLKQIIGDYSGALMHAHKARETSQSSGDLYMEALALDLESSIYYLLGNDKKVTLLCPQARQLLKLCGMNGGSIEYHIMTTQAFAYSLRSEYAEARNIHTEIVHNTSAQKDPHTYAFGLLNIAQMDVMIGASATDVHLNIQEAMKIFSTMKLLMGTMYCDIVLADLYLREGKHATAKDVFQHPLNSSWGKDAEAVNHCLERLANIGHWSNIDFESASKWPVVYLANARRSQRTFELHKALQFLGDVVICQGDKDTASSLFEVALDAFTKMDIHRSRAECMLRLGDIAKDRGDYAKAVEYWSNARPLFERSLQANDVAKINTRLTTIKREAVQRPQDSGQHLKRLDVPTTPLCIWVKVHSHLP